MTTLNLQQIFAVLKPDLSVDLAKLSATLYQDLDANYDQFRGHTLVAIHEFDKDWGMWERHPAGDELVVLLSGAAKLTIRAAERDQVTTLSEPGSFVVVPRNSWHTAQINQPTRMLFITPGEGTDNQVEPT